MENTEHQVLAPAESAIPAPADYALRYDPVAQLKAEVASLTAMNSVLTAEVDRLMAAAKYQAPSIESLVVTTLADKIPQAIEAEIAKQFDDFFNAEIGKRVEEAIAAALDNSEVDCEEVVEAAIRCALDEVRIEFRRGF